jgi:hypothetical protein
VTPPRTSVGKRLYDLGPAIATFGETVQICIAFSAGVRVGMGRFLSFYVPSCNTRTTRHGNPVFESQRTQQVTDNTWMVACLRRSSGCVDN